MLMKLHNRITIAIGLAALVLSLMFALLQTPLSAQAPTGQAPAAGARGQGGRGAGGFNQATDPRVQNRTYKFEDTGEDLPYCVFVSSKVSKDKKNPLIISLHGLGIGPGFMCRGKALDLAEEGGYILAAPMGYNTGGWYGSPVLGGRGARGARGAQPAAQGGGQAAPAPAAPPANLAELSEKDVMNVLAMMRKEFNVDENRTYLMGHSMGGAGAFFLGSKHAKEWAALAPIAPAAFSMNNNRAAILQAIKDAKVPLFVTTGDADEAVPVTNTRMWADTMKELQMNSEYKEYPGVTHGPIIEAAMPDIFAFFAKHTKAGR
jgi:poly(3-hydroxybutyrate) depolymerase